MIYLMVAISPQLDKCMEHAEHELDGRKLDLKSAVPRGEAGNTGPAGMNFGGQGGNGAPQREVPEEYRAKVFVGGLSFETTKESMDEHFATFGAIKDSVVMTVLAL
jgi:hypothetical protein